MSILSPQGSEIRGSTVAELHYLVAEWREKMTERPLLLQQQQLGQEDRLG